jgi:hypothetical protein
MEKHITDSVSVTALIQAGGTDAVSEGLVPCSLKPQYHSAATCGKQIKVHAISGCER